MKSAIFLLASFLLFSVTTYAGQGYDTCLRQEQTLRSNEMNQCAGLQYLFNPSGCFATKKALKEFDEGKCTKIGKTENVPVIQVRNSSAAVSKGGSDIKVAEQPPQELKVKQAVQVHDASIQANPQLDSCRRQEQELRKKEADLCSGVKYWFNPSACFAAKKLLAEYNEGKCRKIAPVVNALSKEPVQEIIPAASSSPQNPSAAGASPAIVRTEPAAKTGEAGSLHEENARIRAENEKLKSELEQLRKTIK